MDETQTSQTSQAPSRNPATQAAHKRQVLWQITIPFLLGLALILAVAVLASLSGPESASLYGDISLIWMILPLLVVLLIGSVIMGGLVYLVVKMIHALPGLAYNVHNLVKIVQGRLTGVADMTVKPVYQIAGINATVTAVFKAILGR